MPKGPQGQKRPADVIGAAAVLLLAALTLSSCDTPATDTTAKDTTHYSEGPPVARANQPSSTYYLSGGVTRLAR